MPDPEHPDQGAARPDGLSRVQAAIDAARGGQAPKYPVRLCGGRDPNAWRADDPRWAAGRAPMLSARDRIWAVVEQLLICPGCLSFRGAPGHLIRKLTIGGCNG